MLGDEPPAFAAGHEAEVFEAVDRQMGARVSERLCGRSYTREGWR